MDFHYLTGVALGVVGGVLTQFGQQITVGPKSCRIIICLLELPPDMGMTLAPIFSAP